MIPHRSRLGKGLAAKAGVSRTLARSRFLTLKLIPSASTRLSIVVPKRVLKLAVDRNRTRRRLSALLRPLLTTLLPGGYLITVVAVPERGEFSSLRADIAELFSTARRQK